MRRQRASWSLSNCVSLFAIPFIALSACQFDTSNKVLEDADTTRPDADLARPDAISPEDCPEPIFLQLRINGQLRTPQDGLDPQQILLGDTIELNAQGSCTKTGSISHRWTIGPQTTGIGDTAMPGLDAETLTV